jgi:hypothetical protein
MSHISLKVKQAVSGVALVAVGLGIAVAGVAYATVPTFSQTNLTVGVGQSISVTSQNSVAVYVTSNSGANYVSASTNGTQLTLTGIAPGSATLDVCGVGTASDCTDLYITIQAGAVTTSSSTTTVASSTSGLTFSENNVSLAVGGTQTISISGGDGVYNVTGNTTPSVASDGMSGSTAIVIDGLEAGSDTITLCDTSSSNICGSISVTVGSSGSTSTSSANQNVSFSVTNPSVAVGQTVDVTLSGGATTYVVLANENNNIAQATTNGGSVLAITGESAGTDSLTICATAGGCTPLSVTVTGTAATTTAQTTTTPTTTTTVTAQPTTTVSASVVANAALLSEIQTLQTAVSATLTQIESIQSQLSQLEAQVNAGSGSGINTTASPANTTAATSSEFTELLTLGSQDAQVTALQQRLTQLGFYSGPVTSYFGSLTESAVMKYQTAHNLTATGSVGPTTRADLNAGE